MKIDPELIIPDKRLSITTGGLKASGWAMEGSTIAAMYMKGLAEHYGFLWIPPWENCRRRSRTFCFTAPKGRRSSSAGSANTAAAPILRNLEAINNLERCFRESSSNWVKEEIETYMSAVPSDACQGRRLSPRAGGHRRRYQYQRVLWTNPSRKH